MATDIELQETSTPAGSGEVRITSPDNLDIQEHNPHKEKKADLSAIETVKKHWHKSKTEIVFILKWAWPMVVSNLLNNVSYLFINLIFVGRLSRNELAAAALANTWTYGTQAFSLGINNACDTLVSQSWGAENYVLVGLTVQRATIVTTGVTVLVAVLWALTEKFLLLVQQDPTISYLALKYVLYLMPGLWFGNVLNVMQKYVQGQGLMMPSIYIGLALNAMNVLFNFVFVTGIGSYSGMGYVGSALSTSISLHEKSWFGWSRECWNWAGFKEYLKLGVPAMIQHASESWGFEILTIMAGLLDSTSLDAHSVTYNFTMLTYQIPSGIAIAVSVRVGQLLGSRNGTQARRASWVGFGITLVCMIIVAIVLFTSRFQLGYIYTHHQEVIDMVAEILPIAALFQIFDGAQTIFQGAVRGMGRTKIGAAANFIAFYVIGIPFSAIFAFAIKTGVTGLWWGLCIGLVTISFGLGFFLLKVSWPDEVENAKVRTMTSMNRISTTYLQKHRGSFSSDTLPPGLILGGDSNPNSSNSSNSSDGADKPSKSKRSNSKDNGTGAPPGSPRRGGPVTGIRSNLGLYTEGPAVDQNRPDDSPSPPQPPQRSMDISIDNSSTFVDSTNSSSVCSSLPTTPAPVPANPHINTQLNFINVQLNNINHQLNTIHVQLNSMKSLSDSNGSVPFVNDEKTSNSNQNNNSSSINNGNGNGNNHIHLSEESSGAAAAGVSAAQTRPNLSNSNNSGSAGSDNGANPSLPIDQLNQSGESATSGSFDLLSHINNSINSINNQLNNNPNTNINLNNNNNNNNNNNQFKKSTGMTPPKPVNNNNNNVPLPTTTTTTTTSTTSPLQHHQDREVPINVNPTTPTKPTLSNSFEDTNNNNNNKIRKPVPSFIPPTPVSTPSQPLPIPTTKQPATISYAPSSPTRFGRSPTISTPNSPVNNLIRNFNQISEQATKDQTLRMLRPRSMSVSFNGFPQPPGSPRSQITTSQGGLFTTPPPTFDPTNQQPPQP
ncbi:multi antimicrobial extrusion family protein [Cavenderia fasciculata]|uniref:Multi antimicrobial extrusion family protein n=1 Tax=Cavenderia fasciculata TaxID=261658 RepID=F4Q9J4_CACFS|nr:multi antimicrobial extrusion family protein [Cavenderia fasciculata]EGG15363.1 multi antimicrobial extrusion family protein [Cavenderia fasciculata]|eukprot:XP_004354105.1 multi antimicrobial extrusion family protein [Cavenderia fasciculata]